MTRACVFCGVTALVLAGCQGGKVDRAVRPTVGGDRARGEQAIYDRGCGACHEIPGVRGARGLLAPPLGDFAQRTFIAGQLPNNPDNLIRWIMDPRSVEPATAMPNLGIGSDEARDIVAYLYAID